MEADGLAATGAQNHFALTVGKLDADQAVVVAQVNRDDAAGARPRECGERSFLDGALAGRHEHEMLLVVLLHGQHGVDFLALLQRQQVPHRFAAGVVARLWQLVNLQPIDLAAIGEAQDGVMSVRHE